MPRLPMPKTNEEAYRKNTKEQYEALGRFVEAFEAMVNEARSSSIGLLANDEDHEKLVDVAFHHPALSAKPLFEIMRTIIAELLKQPKLNISVKERDTFFAILS